MNKTKLKFNSIDEFSPWEEEFTNLVNQFDSKRHQNIQKRRYLSLQVDSKQKQLQKGQQRPKSKSMKRTRMTRTKLNVSKLNFMTGQTSLAAEPFKIKNQSRPFPGPRLTFYSKMNPINSRRYLMNNQLGLTRLNLSERYPIRKMFRQESIKYLQIVDEQPIKPKHTPSFFHSIYPVNHVENPVLRQVVRKEEYHTMKRLAILHKSKIFTNRT